jgi:hypothetical protein
MKIKKTDPTLSDYKTLVERLCKANKVSEFEDIYNGFFKTKEPVFPKYLIKTGEDEKLVKGWIHKVYNRIAELKASEMENGLEAGSFLTVIAGDLFLGLGQ